MREKEMRKIVPVWKECAKIEFASDMEKNEFLAMVEEMQKELVELPDLLGVN